MHKEREIILIFGQKIVILQTFLEENLKIQNNEIGFCIK